jgi:hypothetical protein
MQFSLHACGACLPASFAVHLALLHHSISASSLSAPHPAAHILFYSLTASRHYRLAVASARRVLPIFACSDSAPRSLVERVGEVRKQEPFFTVGGGARLMCIFFFA